MPRQRSWLPAIVFLSVVCSANARQATAPAYPQAYRDHTVDNYFGHRVPAPYRWMEQLDSPRLHAWVAKENAFTASRLQAIASRSWIHHRLTQLQDVPHESVPYQAGNMLFYSHNTGLQNQGVLFVKADPDAPARILLDPNTLSKDGSIALLDWRPSDHGKHVVYGLSQGGSDWETLHVLDTASGKPTDDVIHWVKFSGLSWTADGKGFFYSRYPAPAKGQAIADKVSVQSLYYHRLGSPQGDDTLIYSNPKLPEWVVGGQVSEDGRFLFVTLNHGTSSNNRLYIADLGDGAHPDVNATLQPVYTDDKAEYQPVGHLGDTIFLLTTRDAKRGRIVAFDVRKPAFADWKVIVPEGASVIQNAQLAGGKLLVNRLVDVKSDVSVYTPNGRKVGSLPTPTVGTVYGIQSRKDRDTVYFGFTSFLYPGTVYRYDVASGKASTFFKPDVPFNATKYATKQVFYHSKDGTRVPMFITYRKGIKLDGANPTLLYAYGGFDISITPSFSNTLPTWLDMGGIYAVANIRGGGEYGQAWHHAGMLGNKQNVFDDFAWAAKYLIVHHYTSTPHLGIEGYSNGGLLVGASITEHPELFGAAYAGAGVQDMLRYQKFSGGALWSPEYGTSDKKKDFDWLIKYSPVQNVKPGTCYPPTILTTADHDDRVVPSHTYKFAASLQHAQDCANPILLRVDTQTSHNYMPTNKRIDRAADVLAFMAQHLGASAPLKTGDGK